MPIFQTVVPIRNVDLGPDTTVEFAGGLRLAPKPSWMSTQSILRRLSEIDREDTNSASHAFVVSYEAASVNDPDPSWDGAYPKLIQESKHELCVLANLALWLARPSPASFSVVVHAPQFGAEPVAQQVQRVSRLLCHPNDEHVRITDADLASAVTLHQGLSSIERKAALFTTIRAVWAGLQMNREEVRFVLFWIALEALFGPEDAREITYRLSQRLGFFLGRDRSEARDLFTTSKNGYAFRSKIVHGRWRDDVAATTRMAETETILRRSMVRVLESPKFIDVFSGKQREAFLDDLIFQ